MLSPQDIRGRGGLNRAIAVFHGCHGEFPLSVSIAKLFHAKVSLFKITASFTGNIRSENTKLFGAKRSFLHP